MSLPTRMRLLESGDRLVLHDTARAQRVLGSVFVFSGLFVLLMPWTLQGWDALAWWQRLAILVIGASHLAGGAWAAMDPPAVHVKLDRRSGEGELRWLRPWTTGTGDEPAPRTRFRLADVRNVAVVPGKDHEGDPTWSLRLALADGTLLPLQAAPLRDEGEATALAARVRGFVAPVR